LQVRRASRTNRCRAFLGVLDRAGFLATAETYYSERTDKPKGPPPAKKHILMGLLRKNGY